MFILPKSKVKFKMGKLTPAYRVYLKSRNINGRSVGTVDLIREENDYSLSLNISFPIKDKQKNPRSFLKNKTTVYINTSEMPKDSVIFLRSKKPHHPLTNIFE